MSKIIISKEEIRKAVYTAMSDIFEIEKEDSEMISSKVIENLKSDLIEIDDVIVEQIEDVNRNVRRNADILEEVTMINNEYQRSANKNYDENIREQKSENKSLDDTLKDYERLNGELEDNLEKLEYLVRNLNRY
ncbi:PspA/IM30 family protein [Staphylococcus epidermidis]|nr:PspA/IM30 family protein [Staphylococcus epidermidis]